MPQRVFVVSSGCAEEQRGLQLMREREAETYAGHTELMTAQESVLLRVLHHISKVLVQIDHCKCELEGDRWFSCAGTALATSSKCSGIK